MKKIKRTYNRKAAKNRQMAMMIGAGIIILVAIVAYLFRPQGTYVIYRLPLGSAQEEVETTHSLSQAISIMHKQANPDTSTNAIVTDEDGRRLAIAYGIVDFNTQNRCGVNTTYERKSDKAQGYTNGCYGADGLFIDVQRSNDAYLVEFQQAGVRGYVPLDQIELRNYFDTEEVQSVQYYAVSEGILQHSITTDVTSTSYAVTLTLGKAPDDMPDGIYFSYDGHSFYTDMVTLVQATRNSSTTGRINKNAFYFPYQFMSQEQSSNYTATDIDTYIQETLGVERLPSMYPMEADASQLFESGAAFLQAQKTYQVNAVAMFALACNESNYGRSQLAYDKKNLFGHAAYDDSPTQSAATYETLQACINAHADIYLKQGYFNSADTRYHGNYFGDKQQGMNVAYASDPYWGEKAAVIYRQFDETMRLRDAALPLSDEIRSD